MGLNTKVEWADVSWNPWQGCTPVSEGCENCYAARGMRRFGKDPTKVVRSAATTFNLPLAKKRDGSWKIPSGSFVFVCSWSDFFHEGVPDEWRDEAMAMMCLRPRVTFLLLTKRPVRMAAYFVGLHERARGYWHGIAGYLSGLIEDGPLFQQGWAELWKVHEECFGPRDPKKLGDWSLPTPWNIWRGVTAENQAMADERIPKLLEIDWPGKKFVSLEPLLGPVEIAQWLGYQRRMAGGIRHDFDGIGWTICGAESGPAHRVTEVDWVRSIRDQCVEAGVPYFLKQMRTDGTLVKMPKLDGKVWDQRPEVSNGVASH